MPERSRCGILNREKEDVVKLNSSTAHNCTQYFRRTQANEKTNLKPKKNRQERAIMVARKMEILSKKANQVSVVYLLHENRRWGVI